MRRSAMPVNNAPRRAISWKTAFLLLTRSCARTPRGARRSAMSIAIGGSSLLERPVALARTGCGVERRVDPADIAVAAPVDEVEPTMRAVAEQQHRRVGQVHPH